MARVKAGPKVAITDVHLTGRLRHYKRWVVAECPELEVITQGDDDADARRMLLEALQITLEECARMGTLDQVLSECGFLPVQSGQHLKIKLKFRDGEVRSLIAQV